MTETGFIRSRFLDDKAGVAVIYGALAALKAADTIPAQDTYILIANYEEVGHGGSAGFPSNFAELLSIDMGAIGDGQAGDEFSVSICVKDGGGPYHFDMNNKLRRLAEANDIAYKVDIYVYYSSDGTAFWRAGGDAKVGLAGPGVEKHSFLHKHCGGGGFRGGGGYFILRPFPIDDFVTEGRGLPASWARRVPRPRGRQR